MFKKTFIVLSFLLFTNYAFAMDRAELNVEFFSRFNDCYLPQYIEEALENNHNAKQATARVEQYRQQAKTSLGKELPTLSVGANYLGISTPQVGNFQLDDNAFVLPFIASYEADLLLKNRDKTKSAKKSYEASKHNEKAIYLALLTDIATIYTNILQYDDLIKKQERLIETAQNIVDNDNKKFGRGVINSSTLNNSQKDLEIAKNNLENLLKQREIALIQLSVLLGRSPEGIDNLQRGDLDNFEYQNAIPNEIESDVIFSRPDVMEAEAKLEKAKIDIRVARKEFLPRFNITGIWAFNTLVGGNFFSWESSLAALLAGAMQDIFAGGKKVSNLKFQKAKYEELFENYKQVDLEAIKEVNTALCIIKHDTNIDNNAKNQLLFERKNYIDSQKLLNSGVISNNDFLNEQRRYLTEEFESAQTKSQRLVNYFTLYKAVGGKL